MSSASTKRTIRLDTLTPNEHNPRVIDAPAFDRLVQSLQRDPWVMHLRPIVVDPDHLILGGNQRYRALQQLGYEKVPAAWVTVAHDLTPEQRRRFILVDNHPEGMSGQWDADLLSNHFDLTMLADLGLDLYKLELVTPPAPLNPMDHWGGMPSFDPTAADAPWLSITVHFPTEDSYHRFLTAIGQEVPSLHTRYIWHPKQVRLDLEHHTT